MAMNESSSPSFLQHFAIPGILVIGPGGGGLTRIAITNRHAHGELYLQGAQLTGYQAQQGTPLLWMSPRSAFTAGTAIRGGIPICWPWFGASRIRSDVPAHGFARTADWQLVHTAQCADGSTQVELELRADARTMALWPYAFRLGYTVTIGKDLRLELRSENLSTQAMPCEQALHTYISVADVRATTLHGLDATSFLDKVANSQQDTQLGPLRLVGETDRVFMNSQTALIIDDPGNARRIHIAKSGSDTTVVWNPWQTKAEAMSDMDAQSWSGMLCVESANAGVNACVIPPGYAHLLRTCISTSSI
jgi:glucose-6-phosphate 1-epimerase